MSFFKRELSPVERFENALREKQTARLKLVGKSRAADAVVADRRKTAERLAVAGAADAKLARAESELRTVEERAKTLRAELAEFDENSSPPSGRWRKPRPSASATALPMRSSDGRGDREGRPRIRCGAAGLLAAAKGPAPTPQAARFSARSTPCAARCSRPSS